MDTPTSTRFPTTSACPRLFRARTSLAHFPLLTCTLIRALWSPLSPCARNQTASLPLTEARNHFEANAARDGLVELSGALRTIAVGLNKIQGKPFLVNEVVHKIDELLES